MAFDEDLAERVREILHAKQQPFTEKRMFGGLAFLVDGNMAVSASGQGGLLLRVDPALMAKLLQRPHAHPAVMRGREMDGWLRVDSEGARTKKQLERWVSESVAYAQSLPAKPKAVKR